MTSYESFSPQRGFTDQLNGLQVSARPLFGEPFFVPDGEGPRSVKSALLPANENFKTLMAVFPEYTDSKNDIYSIDAGALQNGKSLVSPWSYHDLATRKGGLAYRYLDPLFQKGDGWEELYHTFLSHPPEALISAGQTDLLSPVEKYEYLVGNGEFSLTKAKWREGGDYINAHGQIPVWVGHCHGTAPATLAQPRPAKAIKLKSFDQKEDITFYPSDIKQLLSYAWAVSGRPSAMIGTRCGSALRLGERPPFNCLDTNPGAFHLATVNLMGLHGQPFIIDSSPSNEVWNQPVVSYNYRYFRPGTTILSDDLKQSMVALKDYKGDPYALYRSSRATHLVGVSMDLTLLGESKPSAQEADSSEADVFHKLTYWYDLELDENGVIVGGEWHNLNHPDFMWVIAKNYYPRTFNDAVIGDGLQFNDGRRPLAKHIAEQAKLAANKGELLFTLLEAMNRLSAGP